MRPLVVVTLLIIGLPLSILLPVADAFTYCAALAPARHECSDHLACVGWSRDRNGTERCQYGLSDPCASWATLCDVGRALP